MNTIRKPIAILRPGTSGKIIGAPRHSSIGIQVMKILENVIERIHAPKKAVRKPSKKVRAKILSKLVQDATATEIDFTELDNNDSVVEGVTAEIDGKPANGTFILPDGGTYVFTNGRLSKIIQPEKEQPALAKKVKVVSVKPVQKKIQTPILKKATVTDRTAGVRAWLNERKPKPNPTATADNRFAGMAERAKEAAKQKRINDYLKNKKR